MHVSRRVALSRDRRGGVGGFILTCAAGDVIGLGDVSLLLGEVMVQGRGEGGGWCRFRCNGGGACRG